jgi:UDP-N-acetylglucosamine:LPS N-acetylglucosamine transferase
LEAAGAEPVTPGTPASSEVAPKLLLVGSSGGHLAQLVALQSWWTQSERAWVTFATADAKDLLGGEHTVYWAYYPTTRNAVNLLRNLRLAYQVLRRERPDVIVSTGAAVAVPFFLVARRLGIPTVFIEVYDRINSRTLTGRLCRPITDIFCVQWDEQKALYPGSIVVGPLL